MHSNNNCPCLCLTRENFRQEIIESCGHRVTFGVCCCFLPGSPVGTLVEVGQDFVRTQNDDWVLPLNHIQIYQETAPSNSEAIHSCESDRTFRQAINDLCGQFIGVFSCFCGRETIIFLGILVEVGSDFVEIRFAEPPASLTPQLQKKILPFTNQSIAEILQNLRQNFSIGEDVIIPLSSVCAINKS